MQPLKKAGFRDFFLWLFRKRFLFRIRGHSMQPLLNPGDFVFVQKKVDFKVGDIILFKHPYRKIDLIKKVIRFESGGGIVVQGLNVADSQDSRTFGAIDSSQVVGSVAAFLPVS